MIMHRKYFFMSSFFKIAVNVSRLSVCSEANELRLSAKIMVLRERRSTTHENPTIAINGC